MLTCKRKISVPKKGKSVKPSKEITLGNEGQHGFNKWHGTIGTKLLVLSYFKNQFIVEDQNAQSS